MKVLWEKSTGKAREYESVDAREMLKNSPDLYTDVDPNPPDKDDPDGDGKKGAPQNVGNVENEFRRKAIGDQPPEKERDQVVILNPVTDTPLMAPRAGTTEEDKKAAADAKAKAEAEQPKPVLQAQVARPVTPPLPTRPSAEVTPQRTAAAPLRTAAVNNPADKK